MFFYINCRDTINIQFVLKKSVARIVADKKKRGLHKQVGKEVGKQVGKTGWQKQVGTRWHPLAPDVPSEVPCKIKDALKKKRWPIKGKD
jgi:hypothetical protein